MAPTPSPETLTSLEIPTIPQAIAYMQASCTVLGREDVTHVDLIADRIMGKGGEEHAVGGMVNIATEANNGFTVRWFQGRDGENFKLGQVLGAENNHQIIHRTVTLISNRNTGEKEYATALTDETKEKPKLALTYPKTMGEKQEAEALFVTMASDFKTALETKLADRPDLLDGIEWNAANMGVKRRSRLANWLSRHTLS